MRAVASWVMPTLLEKAKQYEGRRPGTRVDEEKLDLAFAYANSEVTSGQVVAILGRAGITILACCLMSAVRQGKVRIERIK